MTTHAMTLLVSHHKKNYDLLASCICGAFVQIYPVLDGETLEDVKMIARKNFEIEHMNYHRSEERAAHETQ